MRAPSLQKPRDFISVFDEAIEKPADDASDEDRAAFHDRIRIARETGEYADVLVPGAQPIKFTLAPLTATQYNALIDSGLKNAKMSALVVRMTCVGLVGHHDESGKPYKLPARVDDDDFGSVLPESFINALGIHLQKHVGDAAADVITRAVAPPPKP